MVQSVQFQSRVIAFGVSLLLWVLLTGTVTDRQEWIAAVLVALVVVVVSGDRLAILNGMKLHLSTPIAIIHYLIYFFKALIEANLDVARRVITPSLPINPELVEIPIHLESPLARMLLANSITLTPGTLSVNMEGDRLLVHWIAVPDGIDSEAAARAVAGGFEQKIGAFLK